MKAIRARIPAALPHQATIPTCDNSGAKVLKLITVVGSRTTKGRIPSGRVGDLIQAAVKSGKLEMRKEVVLAVIVRQKKEYRRPDGLRIAFEDNAAVVLKDDKGNPKGTLIKGPIAKEVAERWPAVAKIASMVV